MHRRHVTINDLAKKLGLSPSTVSRALRNHPDISKETKQRVLAMATKTDYQPNLIAQSLQNRRSNNIGVVVPEIRNTFFSTVISGIEEVAYEAGYTIMVCQSADTVAREVLNIRALAANRVAGMLVSISQETTSYDHLELVVRQGIPLVLFDRVAEDLKVSRVIVDDYKGAYEAVQHLVERGRKRIAHIGGTRSMYVSRARRQGYEAALRDNGLQVSDDYILYAGYHEEDGRRAAERLMSLPEPPDAIFTINDPVAIGAFVYLDEVGVKIPDDVALVGFSNNPNTALVRPKLTTVNQPAFEIGRRAAELLLKNLTSESAPATETIVLPTTLVVREST
ncbi:LacI family DNA-binding transcriptional regulator [Desulfosediminicola sp.]|uniref:LacI family DNA-binding transcriptional regulator n=1 Tax=Desulfosediminicola sp. TaxID=2886825 RepID=UPI003AF22383